MKPVVYRELTALKGLLREKKYSYEKLAKKSNISTLALNSKLNGYTVFNSSEVDLLVTVLKISPTDIVRYFFCVLHIATSEQPHRDK